jgi:hypothetical protein
MLKQEKLNDYVINVIPFKEEDEDIIKTPEN